jgi:hypothetical protein
MLWSVALIFLLFFFLGVDLIVKTTEARANDSGRA